MPKFKPLQFGLFLAAGLILALQASASHMLKVDETKIGIPGLHAIPWQLGPWRASTEGSIGADVEAYLKPDEYILRDYVDAREGDTINLFVAYFKSLQNTYGPHSPRICLPGSGWLVSSSKVTNITVPSWPRPVPVNEYTMEKGGQHILVLYWYQNDRDAWAEEFHAKLRLLPDLIRYRRSDVSLVRLVEATGDLGDKKQLSECLRFTADLFPLLVKHFASVSRPPA